MGFSFLYSVIESVRVCCICEGGSGISESVWEWRGCEFMS